MIEPTDEMGDAFVQASRAYWTVLDHDTGLGGLTVAEHYRAARLQALTAVLALVERDYDVQRRMAHGWPARVWPLNRGALHPHYCVTCSDGHAMGPGCINCRQTGYDQTPWPNCQECQP